MASLWILRISLIQRWLAYSFLARYHPWNVMKDDALWFVACWPRVRCLAHFVTAPSVILADFILKLDFLLAFHRRCILIIWFYGAITIFSFIHLFIQSLYHSYICSLFNFIHSSTDSLILLFNDSFFHMHINFYILSFIHSALHPCIHL